MAASCSCLFGCVDDDIDMVIQINGWWLDSGLPDSMRYDAVCRACTGGGYEIAVNAVRHRQEPPGRESRSPYRCWVSSVLADCGAGRDGRAEDPGTWDDPFFLPVPYP